ncbi:glycosyltransferase family 39 protein [filamentous cyanobacterium LEGE 11480]|uniref:Glycosyltransferase family 39 protein n=1 Tax=Romeriopsis navalis LEGE 11480 TaxID=2777977 RepID=A0A928Z327_9CYAN|nr:glycosyltransferase family 39 protein [Romeriopsis navalis]MBE9030199.1 glycosyltransferase family 39 protein [Romeriopsis navalis LEGE 11480]
MKRFSGLRGMVRFIPIVIITLGIVFRISHLDAKVYWGDEVYSSLRIFGHSTQTLVKTVATSQPVSAEILQQFQQKSPSLGVADTVKVLAKEDAHLPPLYFVLARLWADVFGDSIVALRSLSVLFSLLALPCFYGLALELFGQVSVAWMMVLLAVSSPVQLVFAQEARFYSLWVLTTALASWCLLRALRQKTWMSWGIFTLTLILNLYGQFLALLTLAGYGVYVLLTHYWGQQQPIVTGNATAIDAPASDALPPGYVGRPFYAMRGEASGATAAMGATAASGIAASVSLPSFDLWRWRSVGQFMLASGLGVLAFVPWLWIYLTRTQVNNHDRIDQSTSLVNLARSWFVNFSRLFIDFNWDAASPKPVLLVLALATLGCVAVVAWALYRMCREVPLQTSLFVIVLIGLIPLLLVKMALHGAFPARYLLPTYMGIHLALAYGLGTRLSVLTNPPQRRVYSAIAAAILGVGLLSCASNVNAEAWWHKQFSNCNPAIARRVNQATRPLIISDGSGGVFFDHALSNLLSLAHYVSPQTQFQIAIAPQVPQVAAGFSEQFVVTPSQTLVKGLAAQSKSGALIPLQSLTQEYRESLVCLWQLD